jgi:hypothetical protein
MSGRISNRSETDMGGAEAGDYNIYGGHTLLLMLGVPTPAFIAIGSKYLGGWCRFFCGWDVLLLVGRPTIFSRSPIIKDMAFNFLMIL